MHSKSLLLTLTILLAARMAIAQGVGKQIFQARCAACHNIHIQVVGPALAGVDKRRDISWITHFVHSSQTVIKGGDPYADALFIKFNKTVMPDQPDLTDSQIRDIVAYIGEESKNAPAEKPPFEKLYGRVPDYLPLSLHDYGFITGYLGAVLLLVFALLLAVRVKEIEREKKQ